MTFSPIISCRVPIVLVFSHVSGMNVSVSIILFGRCAEPVGEDAIMGRGSSLV